jgi:AraC-like DNA-binding protein
MNVRPDRSAGPLSERTRSPGVRGAPHPALRSVVARDYAGYTDATEPSGGFVLPATTSVLVVVKVQDSALRPPQFVAGLAPETAARLVRFEQVWRRLDDGGPAHWDRIAADVGYADQSHLIRDFREFTGGSPAEFLARSTPSASPAETA